MATTVADTRISLTPQQTRFRRRVRDNLTIILFLLPALTLFLIFVVYPILRSVYFSLFNWKGLGRSN